MQLVLVECLVKLAEEKIVVRITDYLDMTIAVDWDVKHQTEQTNSKIVESAVKRKSKIRKNRK